MFDTAFHRDQPELAQRFALPRRITEQGVRRYGFHGLSYESIVATLPRHLADCRAEGASSSPISATAPRCAPWPAGEAWPPPWASRHSTA
ncbi:MAG: hypothetical protein IPG52_15755 [Rhodocyclaceae bacterium]|nr:hypothetical protein [Rhodocyclaceae bacterium]